MRQLQIKCDGNQPRCGQCRSSPIEDCAYGNDARRYPRPKQDSMASVANKLLSLENLLKGLDQRILPEQDRPSGERCMTGLDNEFTLEPSRAVDVVSHDIPLQVHRNAVSPARENPTKAVSIVSSHGQSPRGHKAASVSAQNEVRSQDGSPWLANFMVDDQGSISAHGPSSAYHYQDESPNHAGDNPGAEAARCSGRVVASSFNVSRPLDNEDIRVQLVAHAALERQKESAALLLGTYDFDGLDFETAQHLLQIHWNRHHLLFPLTYRPLVLKEGVEDGRYASKLLWNAIFYASALHSTRPHVNGTSPGDGENLKDRFLRRFKELLVDALEKSTLPTISALLIMGSSLLASGSPTVGWNYCGLAYRMIIDMGLHLDPRKTRPCQPVSPKSPTIISFSEAEQEMRRRIFYGAYIMDKFQSLYFGRTPALPLIGTEPPQIFLDTYEDLELWAPYADTSLDANEPFRPYTPRPQHLVPAFSALLRLAEITNDIITRLYMPLAVQMTSDQAAECLKSLRNCLDDWHESLPAHLHFRPLEDPTPPPHHLSLHTTFHALIILVHRPFLPEGHLASLKVGINGVSLEKTCLAAARQICRLAKAYEEAFGLRHAPYLFSYALFSAATVVTRHESDGDLVMYLFLALTRIQRGANFGLLKPLMIIRDLMERVGVDMRTVTAAMQSLDQRLQKEGETASTPAVLPTSDPPLDNHFVNKLMSGLDPTWLEDLGSWQTSDDDAIQWLMDPPDMEDSQVLYGLFEPVN